MFALLSGIIENRFKYRLLYNFYGELLSNGQYCITVAYWLIVKQFQSKHSRKTYSTSEERYCCGRRGRKLERKLPIVQTHNKHNGENIYFLHPQLCLPTFQVIYSNQYEPKYCSTMLEHRGWSARQRNIHGGEWS